MSTKQDYKAIMLRIHALATAARWRERSPRSAIEEIWSLTAPVIREQVTYADLRGGAA